MIAILELILTIAFTIGGYYLVEVLTEVKLPTNSQTAPVPQKRLPNLSDYVTQLTPSQEADFIVLHWWEKDPAQWSTAENAQYALMGEEQKLSLKRKADQRQLVRARVLHNRLKQELLSA